MPSGWYADEHLVGNDLEIDLIISLALQKEIDHLEDTLDYAAVYEVVKQHGNKNFLLLEKLAVMIMDDVAALDDRIKNINIHVKKLNPPIPNFIGIVGIERSKDY